MANKIHVLEGNENRDVCLDGATLDPVKSRKIHDHSPDGFNWGYIGSGPAQLALAVMLEIRGNPIGYQTFKMKYLAPLKQGCAFKIMFTDVDIIKMLEGE